MTPWDERWRFRVAMGVCSVAWLFAVHCGDDETSATPPTNADGAAPQGDASLQDGSSVTDSGSGDANAVDANATDTSVPEDAGVDAAVSFTTCAATDNGKFTAVYPDGGTFTETWKMLSTGSIPGNPWRISNSHVDAGHEYFLGAGPGNAPYFLDGGSYPFTIGFVQTSQATAVPRAVYCFGNGTATREQTAVDLRTTTGKALGTCPGGTAVAGEVTLCAPGSFMCNTPVQGSLTGVTIDLSGFDISGDGADPPTFGVNGFGSAFVLRGRSETIPTSGQTKPLSGIFVTLPTNSAPAAIYCIGAGSELSWATANGTSVKLKNVTKLGECGAAAPGTAAFRLCR